MWVKREIQTFLLTHTKDKILTVLCDGEPQDVIPEELLTGEKIITDANGFQHTIKVPVEPLSCDYMWMKAQHEGALTPLCIIRKNPQVPHTAQQEACHSMNNSQGKRMPGCPVPISDLALDHA